MLQYTIPNCDKSTTGVIVEYAMIVNGAKSLVERCLSYLNQLKTGEERSNDCTAILVDHALIANGLEMLIKKSLHDRKIIRDMTAQTDETSEDT